MSEADLHQIRGYVTALQTACANHPPRTDEAKSLVNALRVLVESEKVWLAEPQAPSRTRREPAARRVGF